MKYFFSGKECPLGHIAKRSVGSGGCWECQLIRNVIWKKANPEKAAEYAVRDYQNHGPRRKEQKKIYRQTSPGYVKRHREQVRQWRLENPCQYKAIRDRYLIRVRKTEAYRLANRLNAARHKQRQWRRSDASPIRQAQLLELLQRHKGRCYWCQELHGANYHLDHVFPLILGGTNDFSNLVVSCQSCNLKKGAKTPLEWAGRLA